MGIFKNDDFDERMKRDSSYLTVAGYSRLVGLELPTILTQEAGRVAAKMCRSENIETGEVADERFGKVKSYPKPILEVVFERFGQV